MKLTFYGAAGQVTGSNFLLEANGQKFLIDCGLFQGGSYVEHQNFQPFPYNPKEIAAVFVTHPHIDHVGRLPKLYKDGFRGKIYSTLPARDFSEILLLDSEHILMQEAEKFKQPYLYGVREVEELMAHWHGVEYHSSTKLNSLTATFYNAGHILGSAFIVIEAPSPDRHSERSEESQEILRSAQDDKKSKIATTPVGSRNDKTTKIIFSGDLGNSPAPIIGARDEFPDGADYCVMESTYGDRLHDPSAMRTEVLEDMIEDTVKSDGVLMIPAFAMERTQDLLYEINSLVEEGRIPRIPIFIDSPLAIKLTEVYKKYPDYFDAATRTRIKKGDSIFNFPGLKMTMTTEESKSINDVPPPKVIIAGAGMSNAGRILHHERRYLSDPNSTLMIVGYQAEGSLGRQLLDGAKKVKMFGEEIAVRCRIKWVSSYSAHADQAQLLEWLKPPRQTLKKTFLVHGETGSATVLAQKIKDELAINAVVVKPGAAYDL